MARCTVPTWLPRLTRDDSGQDVVEYALLTAFFGVAVLVAWTSLRDAVGASYGGATAGVQGLWDPPPPSAAPPGGP